jgi:hypothetical protein
VARAVTDGVNGFNAIEGEARLRGVKEGKSRRARYCFDSTSSRHGAGRPDSVVTRLGSNDAGGG